MLGKVARFAKDIFKGIPKEELAVRLGTDALGGLMAAAYTPGDLGDKLIAGTGATVGGAAGGLALGKLGGKNQLASVGLDMAGSIGGDMLLSRVGEEVMKGKSYLQGEGYMNPYEKLNVLLKHLENPLIFDSQIARNAGIIFDNDINNLINKDLLNYYLQLKHLQLE